jgi:YVTN family beta-propeller protein
MPHPLRMAMAVLASSLMLAGTASSAQSAEDKAPLQLEAKVLLGDVRGRIDHLAIDLKRQHLFVAELGNDTVGVIDLANRNFIRRITGLNEPQGVAYEPSSDALLVANARDGSVRLFDGSGYKETGRVALGSDADNIRIDAAAKQAIVGYGEGGLAFLDPRNNRKIRNVSLMAHPESFQIAPDGRRIFVNLPGARAIAVVDTGSGKLLASWPMDKAGNYAMALDNDRARLLVAFRSPPELVAFTVSDGKSVATAETCGDVDDVSIDAKRNRVYVSCGAGYVEVFETDRTAYRRIARIPSAAGARTSLFVPELDLLLVAVRAGPAGPAAIWLFRPTS